MKQRVDEVYPQQHGDAQPNDRFRHVRLQLKTRTAAHIKAHEAEEHGAEAEKDKIEHGCLPSQRRARNMCEGDIKELFRIPPRGIKNS